MISVLGPDAAIYRVSGEKPQRTGSRSLTTSPRNVYETSDGRFIAISASIQAMAERLFRAIGTPGHDRRSAVPHQHRPGAQHRRVRRHRRRLDRRTHAGREHGGVRGRRGDRDADLRDRPVARRSACAGARRAGRGAGRGSRIGADAQHHSAPVGHARPVAVAGAGTGPAHAVRSGIDRLRRRPHRRAGGATAHDQGGLENARRSAGLAIPDVRSGDGGEIRPHRRRSRRRRASSWTWRTPSRRRRRSTRAR